MSRAWLLVIVVGAATLTFKALGPVIIGGRPLPAALNRVVALLAPTLLAALVVVSTFATGRELVVNARVAGMAAAVTALVLRAPIIVVVASAAIVAALVRAV